ncbi:AraC family transcriptional regulator [Acinetobacter sp. ANC 4169]|uniref:AraC family transcriptional regulator n=1 Tax=Acinetobacter sp. ANC 4169 TaxID=1977879 RepID=UPI00148ABF93|nr:AraC family transcriptional regulator [Acinetobacter sp. ANC 4169]
MQKLSFDTGVAPELVLSNYEVCHSSDIEEIRSSGAKMLCANDLRVESVASSLNAQFFYRKIGNIGVGRMSYGGEITIQPAVFEDFFLIQIPIRGFERITLGKDKILCTPKEIGIINPYVKSVINHQPDTEKLVIRIDKKLVEKNCQQILNRTLNKNIEFDPTMSVDTKAGIQWLRMVNWISNFVSDEDDLSPLMVSQIENNLVNMLLNYQLNTYSHEIHNDSISIAPAFVKKVEYYIQENAKKAISINDLAEFAGVSARSLFNGFKKYRNTTPMHFLKEIRLQYAYEDLKNASLGTDKVTTIAFKWGFNHLGHFSTDYKHRFGETPYETLSR